MITTGGQLAIFLNKLIDDLDGLTVTISQNVNFKTFLWCFVPIHLIVKMSLVQEGESVRSLKWAVARKWTVSPKVDGLEPKWTVRDDSRRSFEPKSTVRNNSGRSFDSRTVNFCRPSTLDLTR